MIRYCPTAFPDPRSNAMLQQPVRTRAKVERGSAAFQPQLAMRRQATIHEACRVTPQLPVSRLINRSTLMPIGAVVTHSATGAKQSPSLSRGGAPGLRRI